MTALNYSCFACFYKLDEILCRLYVDIRKDDVVLPKHPEIIFVMLNPGSCDNEGKFCEEVRVKPDATLHRIITFMQAKDLCHGRILNLSDIRNEKSGNFFKMLAGLEKEGNSKHSIFHASREKNLLSLAPETVPVLFACGTNPKARYLLNAAVNFFGNDRIINRGLNFYHPLMRPNKNRERKWLDLVLGLNLQPIRKVYGLSL
ncbi:DUF1643 domain-containing protein [Foetidibacter luteolus]|uniref:DUF1643 domain-containing protein n=1 Tax=Foetidibacter luteolus TaxID=2608880 RepID=UPI00129ACA6D|nr:DUF1643 domain-containing protein [Foetidibacter luteolus]